METPKLWDCTWELAEVSARQGTGWRPVAVCWVLGSALLEQLPPELCSRVP